MAEKTKFTVAELKEAFVLEAVQRTERNFKQARAGVAGFEVRRWIPLFDGQLDTTMLLQRNTRLQRIFKLGGKAVDVRTGKVYSSFEETEKAYS